MNLKLMYITWDITIARKREQRKWMINCSQQQNNWHLTLAETQLNTPPMLCIWTRERMSSQVKCNDIRLKHVSHLSNYYYSYLYHYLLVPACPLWMRGMRLLHWQWSNCPHLPRCPHLNCHPIECRIFEHLSILRQFYLIQVELLNNLMIQMTWNIVKVEMETLLSHFALWHLQLLLLTIFQHLDLLDIETWLVS